MHDVPFVPQLTGPTTICKLTSHMCRAPVLSIDGDFFAVLFETAIVTRSVSQQSPEYFNKRFHFTDAREVLGPIGLTIRPPAFICLPRRPTNAIVLKILWRCNFAVFGIQVG